MKCLMNKNWLSELDAQDINFIKKFILASGSLKEVAKLYRCFVSYSSASAGSSYTKNSACGQRKSG